MIPLSQYLAAWRLLPNISQWVLRTIEEGYRIQFNFWPRFSGIPTRKTGSIASTGAKLFFGQHIPLPLRESGFYSQYFLVPKRDGGGVGGCPILDLQALNRTPQTYTIDLKDTYFHLEVLQKHRQFLTFAFGGWSLPVSGSAFRPSSVILHIYEVLGSSVTPGHTSTQLYRWLAEFSQVERTRGSASKCQLLHEAVSVLAQEQGVTPIGEPHERGVDSLSTLVCLRLLRPF